MAEKYEGSRAYEILRSRFGVGATIRERVLDVSTAGTLIAEVNPRRLLLMLVNHGSVEVRVGMTIEIATAYGIIVSGYGGTLTMVLEEDFEAVCSNWYGVSSGASSPVYVLEVIGQ